MTHRSIRNRFTLWPLIFNNSLLSSLSSPPLLPHHLPNFLPLISPTLLLSSAPPLLLSPPLSPTTSISPPPVYQSWMGVQRVGPEWRENQHPISQLVVLMTKQRRDSSKQTFTLKNPREQDNYTVPSSSTSSSSSDCPSVNIITSVITHIAVSHTVVPCKQIRKTSPKRNSNTTII